MNPIFILKQGGKMSEYLEQQAPINIVRNPWRRFFARTFDLALYGIFLTSIEMLVLRINTTGKPLISIAEGFISCLIMLVLEPLMLSTVGTTPGKWIFGLVLRNSYGEKVSFSKGFDRTLAVFGRGLGYGIPIYNLVREYKSYQSCDQGEELSWDEGFSYHIKDTSGFRILGFLVSWALIYAVIFFIVIQASLPINRGNITAEEYIENCNDFMSYNEIDFGKKLMSDGTWSKTSSYSSDSYMIYFGTSTLPNHQVITNNGEIQKVVLEIEDESDTFIYNFSNHLVIAYTAFVGADKSLNHKSLYSDEVVHYLNNGFENFEFEIAGFKVSNEVEVSGYQTASSILVPKENEKQYFHLTFTMERIQ